MILETMDLVKSEPATFFAALADPTRLKLIRILARQPSDAALCVNALAMRLGISQPAVSQHLQVLRSVGLVYPVRRGLRVHYYLDRERLRVWEHLVQELFAGTGGEGQAEADATDRVRPCDGSDAGEALGPRPTELEEV
jgi:ArsR family transcriptional regulator, arsenate/arsenite/antimonite-responsive transcriptional repressor